MKQTVIKIEGMMCEHCKMAVTKALSTLDGVHEVAVELNPGQAKVNYDSGKIDIESLKEVIVEKGYRV